MKKLSLGLVLLLSVNFVFAAKKEEAKKVEIVTEETYEPRRNSFEDSEVKREIASTKSQDDLDDEKLYGRDIAAIKEAKENRAIKKEQRDSDLKSWKMERTFFGRSN